MSVLAVVGTVTLTNYRVRDPQPYHSVVEGIEVVRVEDSSLRGCVCRQVVWPLAAVVLRRL